MPDTAVTLQDCYCQVRWSEKADHSAIGMAADVTYIKQVQTYHAQNKG